MAYDNLIHKMAKKNDKWLKDRMNAKWPPLDNPYVPKVNSQQSWTPQYTNSNKPWGSINSWGQTASMYNSVPSTISHGIMTSDDKKITIKKYRSIDDPWEVSNWTESNGG